MPEGHSSQYLPVDKAKAKIESLIKVWYWEFDKGNDQECLKISANAHIHVSFNRTNCSKHYNLTGGFS